jgi:Bacterial cell division membrane protein
MAIKQPKPETEVQNPKRKFAIAGIDGTFFILVMVLLTFGLIMLFSASYPNAKHYQDNSFFYIGKQLIYAVLGLVAMAVLSFVNYKILKILAVPFFIGSLILLILVLVLPSADDMKRWIYVGGMQFQPSEFMKLGVILMFALLIERFASNENLSVYTLGRMRQYSSRMKMFRYGVLPFAVVIAVVCVLMILEPHLSGTILIFTIGVVMMIVGGTKARWFFIIGGVGAAGGLGVVVTKFEYMQERLVGWFHPFSDPRDKTMQIMQSLLTIGSGGLFGRGLGQSYQKFMYLPEPQNDFIFAVVCEELGLVGAAMVIILFVLFIWRGFTIAVKAPDRFGMMVAVGIIAQIGLQALLNIAVVTNTVPNTGISLPFFSSGGTALFMTLAQMGIILNISRKQRA